MKIERIGTNKIRVSVSLEDMMMMGMNFDKIATNPKAANDLFWSLIRRAELETGFTTSANSKLFIEAAPSEKGGLVLYITKLDNGERKNVDKSSKFDTSKMGLPRFDSPIRLRRAGNATNNKQKEHPPLLYSFDSFQDACQLIKLLPDDKPTYITLYGLADRYYMIMKTATENVNDVSILAGEFGKIILRTSIGEEYLAERGKLILKNLIAQEIKKHL